MQKILKEKEIKVQCTYNIEMNSPNFTKSSFRQS